MKLNIKKCEVKVDQRGSFFEILRDTDVKIKNFGQIYITTINSNELKGNHYHQRKQEWFCVLKGKVVLTLKELKSKKIRKITLSDKQVRVIYVPQNIVHTFKNVGNEEVIILAYISESFNSKDPDTFYP